jgi:parallel beta-helix repeat protein
VASLGPVSALWAHRYRYLALLFLLVCGAVAVAVLATDGTSTTPSRQAPLAPSRGKAFYVSPSGSDRGPGTRRRPWRTIGRAMRRLAPGQVAYVRAGTYEEGGEANSLRWDRSGSPALPMTIRGYAGEGKRVVIKARMVLEGDYLRLANLVIDRNHAYSDFDHARTGDVGVWLKGRYDVLEHVEVRNGNMSGVYTTGDHDQVLASYIHDNGHHEELDHGIYLGGSNQVVANNVIDHNLWYGLQVWPSCDACVITSNTFVHNGRSGLLVGGDSSKVVVANNISAFNAEYGIRTFELSGSGNEISANLAYGNKAGPYCVDGCGGGASVSRSRHGSPRFVAPRRNYRLRTGSPAIDTGLAKYAPARDFTGKRRPRGRGPDLGAFER